MAKKAKRGAYKLRFKPTPISRLKHYKAPLRMVGDPRWSIGSSDKEAWRNRERVVYEYEIDRKTQDTRGWSHATYYQAIADNKRIDWLLLRKSDDHIEALCVQFDMAHEEAQRDNAAWDYHHENYIAA